MPEQIILIGYGRMGGSLVRGWKAAGVSRDRAVLVVDPACSADLPNGIRCVPTATELPRLPGPLSVFVATKPNVLTQVLPQLRRLIAADTLFVSVVAGWPIASLQELLGSSAKIVRAMPNIAAAVQRSSTAAVSGAGVTAEQRVSCERLLHAVGSVLWLETEELLDAVTAVAGSGPAYFFRVAEALAEAGAALGLSEEVAHQLARETLCGAGELAHADSRKLSELRKDVTSPGGTTAAALAEMEAGERIQVLMRDAAAAAKRRARELAAPTSA
jgi:pyrroline-5-carboxylate reductase